MTTTRRTRKTKPRRDELKPGECLCDHCTGKCCRYFSLPIDTPTTWDDYDSIRWYLAHDRTLIYVEKGTVVPAGDVPLQLSDGRQPLRDLPQPPQDLPRVQDDELRVRLGLVVREDLRDARADLGVRRGRPPPRRRPKRRGPELPIVTVIGSESAIGALTVPAESG